MDHRVLSWDTLLDGVQYKISSPDAGVDDIQDKYCMFDRKESMRRSWYHMYGKDQGWYLNSAILCPCTENTWTKQQEDVDRQIYGQSNGKTRKIVGCHRY